MNRSQITYMVAGFGWGSGMVAVVVGIAQGNFFIFYIGLVCLISNWLTTKDYQKRLN